MTTNPTYQNHKNMVKAHQFLYDIKNYVPGKSKIAKDSGDDATPPALREDLPPELEHAKKIIKLSSNENALKTSPKALAAYREHDAEIFRYADGACEDLREALAAKHKVAAAKIVCGAGSDEILALLTAAFAGVGDEVIYSAHGFLMYPISARRVGATPIAVAEKNLKTDVNAILGAINDKTKIIFIANPNNPTGSYLNKNEIQKLIDGVPKNVLLVLDHAYDEFAQGVADYPDAIKLVEENENVVTTRTFSKVYGLASLRIGWSFSSAEIAKILNKVRGPFNVSGAAQVAAIAALHDEEFLQKSLKHNQKWRDKFFAEIVELKNIKAWPSIANFILFDFGDEEKCQKANEKFLQNKIILREMAGYGLANCLRMTIGVDEENLAVLKILKQIG